MSIEKLEKSKPEDQFSAVQPKKVIGSNLPTGQTKKVLSKAKNIIFALAFLVYTTGDVLQDIQQGTIQEASMGDIIAMSQAVVSSTYQFFLMCIEKVISLFV